MTLRKLNYCWWNVPVFSVQQHLVSTCSVCHFRHVLCVFAFDMFVCLRFWHVLCVFAFDMFCVSLLTCSVCLHVSIDSIRDYGESMMSSLLLNILFSIDLQLFNDAQHSNNWLKLSPLIISINHIWYTHVTCNWKTNETIILTWL